MRKLRIGVIDLVTRGPSRALYARVIGTEVLLMEYDEDGRAELEFTDDAGIIHSIFVDPKYIDAAQDR